MTRGRDFSGLGAALKIIGYPVRLQMLHQLRVPRPLSEIRVTAARQDGSGSDDRPLARQSVREHLERLMEAGLVRTVPTDHGRHPMYAVDLSSLYELGDRLMDLSRRYDALPSGDETKTMVADGTQDRPSGPRLLLTRGAYEGQAFCLDGAGPWTLGRATANDISLDYDRYVSSHASTIELQSRAYHIREQGSNKNPIHVGGARLSSRDATRLEVGDIVDIGRSRLVYLE